METETTILKGFQLSVGDMVVIKQDVDLREYYDNSIIERIEKLYPKITVEVTQYSYVFKSLTTGTITTRFKNSGWYNCYEVIKAASRSVLGA